MSDEKTAATEPLEAEPKDVSEPANSDPASSLRAAALLTLKSKRRKQADAQSLSIPSLPSRPMVVDTSVQLDYGHEDSIASSPLQPSADTESGQAREEGEISDSEDPAAKSNSPTSSSHRPQTVPSVEDRSTSVYSSSPRQVVLKIESPQPQPTLLDRISDTSAQPRPSSTSTLTDDGNFVQRSYFIDADHVRPGLESMYCIFILLTHLTVFAVNQEQYDTAKDIVLDLLGWAVPPEYLVDCGLSREIVFYVFSELNLRLPDNLDITGLVPYNPTTARSLLRDPNTPLSTNGLRPMGHPSLPPKPVPVDQMQRPSHLAESSHLNDMERQRRQELLARKAVISSRKGKASASTSPSVPPTVTNDQDVEMASLVPKETVDDFLKSIGSVSDAGETRDDHMDVDDIPGLAGPPSHSPSAVSTPLPSFATGETPQTNNFPSASEMLDSGSISRRSSASSEDAGHTNGRKAAKRPVAADFVDFESAPRGHHSTNGNGAVHPHLKRKLGGSFASVSAMRRCVIDLSDSEGEDDNADNRSGLPPVVRRMSVPAGGVGRSTTPPNPPQSAGAVPNRSLAEKEAEIVKMRQMIAERERVKKLKVRIMQRYLPYRSLNFLCREWNLRTIVALILPIPRQPSSKKTPSSVHWSRRTNHQTTISLRKMAKVNILSALQLSELFIPAALQTSSCRIVPPCLLHILVLYSLGLPIASFLTNILWNSSFSFAPSSFAFLQITASVMQVPKKHGTHPLL